MHLPDDDVLNVVEDGLPPLPQRVGGGRRVPVACWSGDRFAAVMIVEEDDPDPYDTDDPLIANVYRFRRIGGAWEPATGWGGTDWPGGTSSSAAAGLGARQVHVTGGRYGLGSDEWSCLMVQGFVGSAGRWVEIQADNELDRRPLHPSNAFVVVHQHETAATVRVLDQEAEVLGFLDLQP